MDVVAHLEAECEVPLRSRGGLPVDPALMAALRAAPRTDRVVVDDVTVC